MKRATSSEIAARIRDSVSGGWLTRGQLIDVRDSDARQRAEIRALRKAAAGLYREVVAKFGWSACVDARLAVAEALAPKRRARK